MLWTPVRSAGTRNAKKPPNPGGPTGPISVPISSTLRRCADRYAIEGFNRQLRKVTKVKSVFPTDDSLLKMLYLAMMNITKSGLDGGRTGA